MATKPKKPITKKKVASSQKTAGKRTRKKSIKKSNLKRDIFIILGLIMLVGLVFFGYFLVKEGTHEAPFTSAKYVESYTTEQLLEDLSKIKTKKPEIKNAAAQNEVLNVEKEVQVYPTFEERGKEEKVITSPKKTVKSLEAKKKIIKETPRGKKPKLVIIIDDVSSRVQMKRIQALGMKITPSIFPPSELSMKSHKLAHGVKNYMIHLPMESTNKQFNTQYKTLMTSFTKTEIQTRVKELRKLFPNARYINNHTGSVFTDNYKAMHILYTALREEGFVFIDSRTIASSKVRKIAHEFGDIYGARDIFIDNEHKVPYIHKQLKKAVKIAKKKGYAIAIGHPHKVTMKALKSAKHILKDVELVYLNAIYRR